MFKSLTHGEKAISVIKSEIILDEATEEMIIDDVREVVNCNADKSNQNIRTFICAFNETKSVVNRNAEALKKVIGDVKKINNAQVGVALAFAGVLGMIFITTCWIAGLEDRVAKIEKTNTAENTENQEN